MSSSSNLGSNEEAVVADKSWETSQLEDRVYLVVEALDIDVMGFVVLDLVEVEDVRMGI